MLAFTLLLLLVAGCATAPRGPAAGSVAVWELDDLGAGGSQAGWGETLSGPVIEALQAAGYPVVERQRLVALLEELKLASSGLADESTRLRLGRLSGARRMVFGAYQSYGGRVRVDLRLVDVETGKVIRAAQESAPAGDLPAALEVARGAARTLVRNSP